ncbi:MAG: hypothetical protein JXM70_26410 [Pirellulales bacterium]|nr:hypothetical protein [Pirellulales bacterium]
MADLVINGDFESVTGGTFDSWTYGSAGSATDYNTAPLAGSHTANVVAGDNAIWQQVSLDGLTDFSWELDYASLPFSSGSRSLHVTTYKTDPSDLFNGNVDSIRLTSTGELQYHNGAGWVNTGLLSNLTPDTGTLLVFDGETPVLNHLKFVASGYGSPEQVISLTLNGSTYTSPAGQTSVMNAAPEYFVLLGLLSASDYLVDNVTFVVPEPSVLMILVAGGLSLLACSRRK